MLWYKSWLETRWPFVIGLGLLLFTSCGTVLEYPQVVRLLAEAPKVNLSGEVGRQVSEAIELSRDYRGYVWSEWFRQNMMQTWSIFAVLLGTGGLFSRAAGAGAVFTLSLPVSRDRLLGTRAATGLVELLILAIAPSLVLPLLSPVVGQSYSLADALVHGACLFVAGSIFFSLTFLLSTVFTDVWRPMLIVLCGAIAFRAVFYIPPFRDLIRFSPFPVMSAETYFHGGGLPWLGLLVSAAASFSMIYVATKNIARQDF